MRVKPGCLHLTITLALVLLPCAAYSQTAEPGGLQAVATIEGAFVAAIAAAEKSVVAIARVKPADREAVSMLERADVFNRIQFASPAQPGDPDFVPNEYGTGVVVDRGGLILTNYHVVSPGDQLFVTTVERKTYPARIKAADPRSDLAVLSIDARDLTPIKLGDASLLKKGQIVLTLGNPYAIARDGQASASWGIISNLARKAPLATDEAIRPLKTTLHQFGTLIQTDAKLNLGTSGGALLNLKGEMIGLTTSLAATAGYEQAAGYAIPVDATFLRALEALKEGREVEYGFLGVRPSTFSQTEILTGSRGVKVDDVVPGTPAQRYGLRAGDVITHVNGQEVFEADQLVLHVGKLSVDAVVRLTVQRDGQVLPVLVELTKNWVPGKKIVTNLPPAWRGLRVDYATASRQFQEQLRQNRGIETDGCIVVTDVEQNSAAWKEGLRPEMFISHVAGTRVGSPKQFRAATTGKDGPVELKVLSPEGGQPATHTVPPSAG